MRRPQTVQAGGSWKRYEDECEPYWAVYQQDTWHSAMHASFVVLFTGGDGSLKDAKCHPGSPARAFVQGQSEQFVPYLPIDLLRRLGEQGEVCLVGYSLGGIAALASALVVGYGTWLSGCVLFNCC